MNQVVIKVVYFASSSIFGTTERSKFPPHKITTTFLNPVTGYLSLNSFDKTAAKVRAPVGSITVFIRCMIWHQAPAIS